MSLTWNPRLVKTPTPTMSAMTIAVAVTHDTVLAELPPEAESVMNKFPFTCAHYRVQWAKIQQAFCFSFRADGRKALFYPSSSLIERIGGAGNRSDLAPPHRLRQKENVAFV
jgi:hypothetical protein